MVGVDGVHGGEVVEILEEDGGFEYVLEAGAGGFEDGFEIQKDAVGLLGDGAWDDLLGLGVEGYLAAGEEERAEADGFTSMWYPSAAGPGDPLAAMTLAARATSAIELGTAVLVTYACHPVLQANRASATASAIGTPGRLTLGVGPSHRVVIEDWLGLSYDTPGRQTDEYVQILAGLLGLAVGAASGAFNGFFIAYLRIQPIVVTLATLFIVQGVALLVSPTPGGYVAPSFAALFTGAAIPGVVPAALVVILIALAVWLIIRNSRLGVSIYAVGSDEDAAAAAGIRARTTKFTAYILAGTYYGAAGIFVGAQSGGRP